MVLTLLVLPAAALLMGFLDNTEQASLKKSSLSASCLLTTPRSASHPHPHYPLTIFCWAFPTLLSFRSVFS